MFTPRLLVLVSLLLSLPGQAQTEFTLEEPSAWVVPTPLEASRAPRDEDAVSGLHLLLWEEQVHVGPEVTGHYVRQVRRVVSARGVATGSEFRVTFSHSHERLRLHGLWRTRDGVRTQVLRASDVKLLQQEERLDQGIYGDERTALVFLPDVRVGDVLEESYTLDKAHPLFRGQHMDQLGLRKEVPAAHLVHRLLAPASLTLHFKTHGTAPVEPGVRDVGGMREYRWDARDVPAFDPEDGVPPDLALWPHVQVSSFQSWADVVSWALTLYEGLPASPEVKARADTWRALPTEEARFLAAVRFVQDEVRYLGIEVGPNTHQPHSPAEVLAQRFGDCKDKAFLLVSLLRELGIPAQTALVNARSQGGVMALLPSVYAFNHVIVRAQVAGRTEWVDATLAHQRGRLGARASLPYGRALVVAPGVSELEPMAQPVAAEPSQDVRYALSLEHSGEGSLTVTTRLSREAADAMRALQEELSAQQFATQRMDRQRRLFAKLRADGLPRVVDDAEANTVTVEEHYSLEDGWAHGALNIFVPQLEGQFLLPRQREARQHPVRVAHPVHVRVRWEVHANALGLIMSKQESVEGPAARMDMSLRPESSGFSYEVEYRSLADRVAPEALDRHLRAMEKMTSFLGLSLSSPTRALLDSSEGPELSRTQGLVLSAVFFLVLAAVALKVPERLRRFIRARRSRGLRRPAPVRYLRNAGDDAPIVVNSANQMEERLKGRRCVCGGKLSRLPEAARLQPTGSHGKSLTLVRVRCANCGTLTSLAFDIRPH